MAKDFNENEYRDKDWGNTAQYQSTNHSTECPT